MTTTARLDPRQGRLRGLRAAVLAVPAVGVAALAHHSVDSCLDLPGLALSLGACWSGAVAVLGARRRLPTLLLWLVGAQVVTHLLLQATCTTPAPLVPGPRGLGAHVVAVVALAVVLHRADGDLWAADSMLRALRRLLAPRVPLLVPAPHQPAVTAAATPWRPRPAVRACPVVRRGPPSSAHA